MTRGSDVRIAVELMAGGCAGPRHLRADTRGGRDGRLPGRCGGRQCSGFSGFLTTFLPPPLADVDEGRVSGPALLRLDRQLADLLPRRFELNVEAAGDRGLE